MAPQTAPIRRARGRAGGALGQDGHPGRRPAGLHRQPRQPAVHAGGIADSRGRRACVAEIDRRSVRRLSDGPVRVDGPRRHRRQPGRCDCDLRRSRRATRCRLPAVTAPGAARRGGHLGRKTGAGSIATTTGRKASRSDVGAAGATGSPSSRRRHRRAHQAGDRERGVSRARRGSRIRGRHRPRDDARCQHPTGPFDDGRAAVGGATSATGSPAMSTRPALRRGAGLSVGPVRIAADDRDLSRPLRDAWIVAAVRTPVGRYGGALAARPPG